MGNSFCAHGPLFRWTPSKFSLAVDFDTSTPSFGNEAVCAFLQVPCKWHILQAECSSNLVLRGPLPELNES